MAFENAVVGDYVSEKVYEALLAGSLSLLSRHIKSRRAAARGRISVKFSDTQDDVRKLEGHPCLPSAEPGRLRGVLHMGADRELLKIRPRPRHDGFM